MSPNEELLLADELKLTPDEWLARSEFWGVVVVDPDGWDRTNFEKSWLEPLTHSEFKRRLEKSTCIRRRVRDQRQSDYVKKMPKKERLAAAKHGWPNWFINRGRMSKDATPSERRRVSWRRAH